MSSNEYYAVYRVFTNLNRLDKEMKIGIMYGIYRDFEIGYEKYQGRSIFNVNFPSSFAPEDLPSDHLGFWTAANGYSKNKIPDLLLCLGEVRDRGPFILNNMVLHVSYESNDNRSISSYRDILPMIYGNGYYRFSIPKNYEFLPMVADRVQYENGEFETQTRNTNWPTRFQIQPIPSGPTTWRKEYELKYK